jgi:GT2 family glycosyltransferase
VLSRWGLERERPLGDGKAALASVGSTMDISVIIPAHNRASLIPATLDSVVSQTFPPREIIVVDDGSTDDIERAMAPYGRRCRLIAISNRGAAGARDIGVKAAASSWLAFCDSDDLWKPDHLAEIAALHRRVPAAEYIFTNFSYVYGDDWSTVSKFETAPSSRWNGILGLPANQRWTISEEPLFPDILEFQPIFPSCTSMSRRFYDRVGGYDIEFGKLPSEDLEFTLRCVRNAPIGIVLTPTVGIRRHAGNDSRDGLRQLRGEIRILSHSCRFHDLPADWRALVERQIVLRSIRAAEAAFASGDRQLVRTLAKDIPLPWRSLKLSAKIAIARLPEFLASPLTAMLVR